jgi:hypothetical protein
MRSPDAVTYYCAKCDENSTCRADYLSNSMSLNKHFSSPERDFNNLTTTIGPSTTITQRVIQFPPFTDINSAH